MPDPAFIAMEGTDRSGKSAAAVQLLTALVQRGHKATLMNDPGSTWLGTEIRGLIKRREPMEPLTEALLFEAARHQMVETRIRPALQEGTTVICARFTTSTRAYQGYGRGIHLQTIEALNSLATGAITPHVTIILDIEQETATERGLSAQDRFEGEGRDFYQRVRKGYLETAANSPLNHRVVDATQGPDKVNRQVLEIALEVLRS